MRYGQAETMEIIKLVEQSDLPVKQTLQQLDINRSTFYNWYGCFVEWGYDGLADVKPTPGSFWNKIPEAVNKQLVDIALEYPAKSARELAWFIVDQYEYYISGSSVYRTLKAYDLITSPAYIVLSAKDKFDQPTSQVNELWQTDFSYFKIIGWGWYYLSTVLDDFSSFMLSWKLFSTMSSDDVEQTLDMALEPTGIDKVKGIKKPRLLSDNGPCYVSKQLRDYLSDKGLSHIRSAAYHPLTPGKIERYHRSLKNVINLDNYFSPEQLKAAIAEFVEYYNHHPYHESLDNLTPADVYYGSMKMIWSKRNETKEKTLKLRRRQNQKISVNENSNKVLAFKQSIS